MKTDEAITILKSINNPEDFTRLMDCLKLEQMLRLETLGYLKEVPTRVDREEFKANRKSGVDKYRYFSKNFNFSAETSGTRYYRRDYILK